MLRHKTQRCFEPLADVPAEHLEDAEPWDEKAIDEKETKGDVGVFFVFREPDFEKSSG